MYSKIGKNFFSPYKILYNFWKGCWYVGESGGAKDNKPPATPAEIVLNSLAFQLTSKWQDVLS
jgi:hypothetical protein